MKLLVLFLTIAMSGCLIPNPSAEQPDEIQRVIDGQTSERLGISHTPWADAPILVGIDDGFRFTLNQTGIWCADENLPPVPEEAIASWVRCSVQTSQSNVYEWVGGEQIPAKPIVPGLPDITKEWNIVALRYIWLDGEDGPELQPVDIGYATQTIIFSKIEQRIPGFIAPTLTVASGDLCEGTGPIIFHIQAPVGRFVGEIDFDFSAPQSASLGEIDGSVLTFSGNGTNVDLEVIVDGNGNLANPAAGSACSGPYEDQRWSGHIESVRVRGNADLAPVPVGLT